MGCLTLIGFTEKVVFALLYSDILTDISRINELITGIFVLISMYFSSWFQIYGHEIPKC